MMVVTTEFLNMMVVSEHELKYYGRQYLIVNPLKLFDKFPPTVESSRYSLACASISAVIRKLYVARHTAEWLKNEMEVMETDTERDYFLMRQFIVNNFYGLQKLIAHRYILGNFYSHRFTTIDKIYAALSFILLPIYFAGMIYAVVVYNVDVGSRASQLWIIVVVFSIFQDAIILHPLKIWLKWVALNSAVSTDARKMFNALHLRFYTIMNRNAGMMRDANSLIQHFNPACRAARMFPGLPISRFLLSMNDHDVPKFSLSSTSSGSLIRFVIALGTIAVYAIALMPYTIQDMVIELVANIFLNGVGLGFILFGKLNAVASALIAIALIAIVVIVERRLLKKSRRRQKVQAVNAAALIQNNQDMKLKDSLNGYGFTTSFSGSVKKPKAKVVAVDNSKISTSLEIQLYEEYEYSNEEESKGRNPLKSQASVSFDDNSTITSLQSPINRRFSDASSLESRKSKKKGWLLATPKRNEQHEQSVLDDAFGTTDVVADTSTAISQTSHKSGVSSSSYGGTAVEDLSYDESFNKSPTRRSRRKRKDRSPGNGPGSQLQPVMEAISKFNEAKKDDLSLVDLLILRGLKDISINSEGASNFSELNSVQSGASQAQGTGPGFLNSSQSVVSSSSSVTSKATVNTQSQFPMWH